MFECERCKDRIIKEFLADSIDDAWVFYHIGYLKFGIQPRYVSKELQNMFSALISWEMHDSILSMAEFLRFNEPEENAYEMP